MTDHQLNKFDDQQDAELSVGTDGSPVYAELKVADNVKYSETVKSTKRFFSKFSGLILFLLTLLILSLITLFLAVGSFDEAKDKISFWDNDNNKKDDVAVIDADNSDNSDNVTVEVIDGDDDDDDDDNDDGGQEDADDSDGDNDDDSEDDNDGDRDDEDNDDNEEDQSTSIGGTSQDSDIEDQNEDENEDGDLDENADADASAGNDDQDQEIGGSSIPNTGANFIIVVMTAVLASIGVASYSARKQ